MATAPPPARQRSNPRRRATALPSSYTSRDTTRAGQGLVGDDGLEPPTSSV